MGKREGTFGLPIRTFYSHKTYSFITITCDSIMKCLACLNCLDFSNPSHYGLCGCHYKHISAPPLLLGPV